MNDRNNIISIIKKQGYERMPYDFNMTPFVRKTFGAYAKKIGLKVKSPFAWVACTLRLTNHTGEFYRKLYKNELKADTHFDDYGVAMEAGSEDCLHLRRFYHPLKDAETLEELQAYPYPKYKKGAMFYGKIGAKIAHMCGKFVIGGMQCTIWEQAWYMRSMEGLMMDMLAEPEMAAYILDRVTENSIIRAENYAEAGVDAIYLGDDIGMQQSIMMSEEMYVEYLKPRLKKVIDAARAINPNVLIFYHSCGFIEPFIPHLIEVGVDVLNPIQPECMDFKDIFTKYGDKISFFGTIGTQTMMPFGTPAEIKKYVKDTLDFVGKKGGLLISPTHILEPEVPPENIAAYIEACKEYKSK